MAKKKSVKTNASKEPLREFPVTLEYDIKLDTNPVDGLKRLLNLLDVTKNLEFFTDNKFRPEYLRTALPTEKFNVYMVSVLGEPFYVRGILKNAFTRLKRHIEKYYEEETVAVKVYELSKLKLRMTEYLYKTDLSIGVLYESSSSFRMHFKTSESINVIIPQINISDAAQLQIRDHHTVRRAFVSLLSQFVDLQIEKSKFEELEKAANTLRNDSKKQLHVLQVWVALKKLGYLDHLPKKDEPFQRRLFFEFFGLNDVNYKNRISQLKRANADTLSFISQMAKAFKQAINK